MQKNSGCNHNSFSRYKVENTGTGPAENVQLNIQWPQTIKNGKWLFYLLEVDVDGTAGNCTIPPEVNPLGLKYVWKKRTPNKRTKREAEANNEAESVDPEEISSNAPTSPYEELVCFIYNSNSLFGERFIYLAGSVSSIVFSLVMAKFKGCWNIEV